VCEVAGEQMIDPVDMMLVLENSSEFPDDGLVLFRRHLMTSRWLEPGS
jgi:hypothetical protein